MNANTIYNQRIIDEQVVKTLLFLSQKQEHITFHKQLALQNIDIYALPLSKVDILPPNNQNLQFSSLHVPKTALESL